MPREERLAALQKHICSQSSKTHKRAVYTSFLSWNLVQRAEARLATLRSLALQFLGDSSLLGLVEVFRGIR